MSLNEIAAMIIAGDGIAAIACLTYWHFKTKDSLY